MRQPLFNSCSINWAKISPSIFGSMFQSVKNPKERRNLGAHYTSEKNILKLIKPLFLNDLWKEFETIKGNLNKLPEFHKKLSTLKFLDPACGCGNFLVITYRELRLLELEVLRALEKSGQGFLNVRDILWLDVDQFYGIELEEFPARIAEVAMWLIDHQMNMIISNEFGQYKIIFEYVDIKGEPHELKAKNINPYLVDAKDLIIQRRSIPLGPINKLVNGSVPADGGNLILTKEDKDFIEKKVSFSRIWIRDYLGGDGFLS